MYVEVAVDFSDDDRMKTYTYSVPSHLRVVPGDLVWVPFGHRPVQGLAISTSQTSEFDNLKDIQSVVEGGPFVSASLLKVGLWIADYYRCGIFRACTLMLPPGANQQLHIWIFRTQLAQEIHRTIAALKISPQQQAVLDQVPQNGKIRRDKLMRIIKRAGERHLDALIRDGILTAESMWDKPRVKPLSKPHIQLSPNIQDPEVIAEQYEQRRANRRAQLIRTLATEPIAIPRAKLSKEFGASVIKSVVEDGNAIIKDVRADRDPLADYAVQEAMRHTLIPEQQKAVDIVAETFQRLSNTDSATQEKRPPHKFLLFGVTGSGKTEVYLRAAELCIEAGKRAIIMVPEIAMTPQTLQRFASRFHGRIALQHSGLSIGQRFDQWHRIRNHEFDIVIGSRSSIFAPIDKLGLIVMDEEHEWTFKQSDRAPRYHARDVAEKLAQQSNAVLILGSATPDIATYQRTQIESQDNALRILALPRRINIALRDQEQTAISQNGSLTSRSENVARPSLETSVEIIDMRQELKAGHREMFSRALLNALHENVHSGGKSILFINRRGTASFIQCATCGALRTCPNCHTPLTLHRDLRSSSPGNLRCHYCGYSIRADRKCRNCGGNGIGRRAAGTQGVEEAIKNYFPRTNVIRWDSDTARNAKQHQTLLEEFQSEGNHILVGTQMVAKGLDIPEVSLVGAVSADIGLAVPSFRSPERTFQILSQVTGRAGRADTPGKAVIQTFMPNHKAIIAAARQDYIGFYEHEIEVREQHQLPPFKRYVRLTYGSYEQNDAQLEAASVKTRIQQIVGQNEDISIVGPSPTFPARIAGRYTWQILLKGAAPEHVLDQLPLGTGWTVDVDPIQMN